MQKFTLVLFATLGVAAAQEPFLAKKCAFLKREIVSGHKAYLSKQSWFPRLARACGFEDLAAPPVHEFHDFAASSHRPVQAEFSAGPMKEALGWAKSAIASKEGAELKFEAAKLASKAKMAFEHQDSEELKEGAADFMGKLKDLWNKNADEEMKRKAAVLLNKAKQTLQAKGAQDLPEEAMEVEEQLKQKVEEKLGDKIDLAQLAGVAERGHFQGQAAELIKMATKKPETTELAKKAVAALEKLKASGLDEKVLQSLAEKAETKLGAIHV